MAKRQLQTNCAIIELCLEHPERVQDGLVRLEAFFDTDIEGMNDDWTRAQGWPMFEFPEDALQSVLDCALSPGLRQILGRNGLMV